MDSSRFSIFASLSLVIPAKASLCCDFDFVSFGTLGVGDRRIVASVILSFFAGAFTRGELSFFKKRATGGSIGGASVGGLSRSLLRGLFEGLVRRPFIT